HMGTVTAQHLLHPPFLGSIRSVTLVAPIPLSKNTARKNSRERAQVFHRAKQRVVTKGACHQATIHLAGRMEHSGDALVSSLGRSGSSNSAFACWHCRSGTCRRHWLEHSDGGRDWAESSGHVPAGRH